MSNLRQSFFRYIGQTSPSPMAFEVKNAQGIYIYDQEGNAYMDMISGISVSSLGHGNPHIVRAVQEQAAQYMHTMVFGEHIQAPQVELAEMLLKVLPDNIQNVYFVNSGSEAVEGAMKLVKKHTGRYEIIACRKAYHGNTHGAQSLMSNEYYSAAYRPFLSGINFIELNNIESLEKITDKTAAVFVEAVQGEAGVKIACPDFMTALRRKCDETRTLLVLDEIQTGFGRTGRMFSFEHYAIRPDVVLMAKALGGGMPIGAFASSKKIMESLCDSPVLGHITSFGGHPVSAAAAKASLEFLLTSGLIGKVAGKSVQLAENLKHPQVKSIRFKGLLMAMDLGNAEKVQRLIAYAFEKRILLDWFLYDDCSVRLAPPIIITEEEIDHAVTVLRTGLDQLT